MPIIIRPIALLLMLQVLIEHHVGLPDQPFFKIAGLPLLLCGLSQLHIAAGALHRRVHCTACAFSGTGALPISPVRLTTTPGRRVPAGLPSRVFSFARASAR